MIKSSSQHSIQWDVDLDYVDFVDYEDSILNLKELEDPLRGFNEIDDEEAESIRAEISPNGKAQPPEDWVHVRRLSHAQLNLEEHERRLSISESPLGTSLAGSFKDRLSMSLRREREEERDREGSTFGRKSGDSLSGRLSMDAGSLPPSLRGTGQLKLDQLSAAPDVIREGREEWDDELPGVIWHVQLLLDGHNPLDQCTKEGEVKPRRPVPHMRASEFLTGLEQTDRGEWVYKGAVNGWPGLTPVRLVSVTCKVKSRVMGRTKIQRLWDAEEALMDKVNSDSRGIPTSSTPHALMDTIMGLKLPPSTSIRATLHAPSWSAWGWTPDSRGFAFCFSPMREGGPSVTVGEHMITSLRENVGPERTYSSMPQATVAHLFAHRYATETETVRDRLTYHAAVLIEWDHGQHSTILELAWWNGLGGYGGKSNWYHDKDDKDGTLMYKMMPDGMKAPWRKDRAEIRINDIPARNWNEFENYLLEYTGPQKRFMDPQVHHSAQVRISHRSQEDILQYILNYVSEDGRYNERNRNCQTFAADMFRLLTGLQAEPVTDLLTVFYRPRPMCFLYDM